MCACCHNALLQVNYRLSWRQPPLVSPLRSEGASTFITYVGVFRLSLWPLHSLLLVARVARSEGLEPPTF